MKKKESSQVFLHNTFTLLNYLSISVKHSVKYK